MNIIVRLFADSFNNFISTKINFYKDSRNHQIVFDSSTKIETEWFSNICLDDKLLRHAFIFNVVDFSIVCQERQ